MIILQWIWAAERNVCLINLKLIHIFWLIILTSHWQSCSVEWLILRSSACYWWDFLTCPKHSFEITFNIESRSLLSYEASHLLKTIFELYSRFWHRYFCSLLAWWFLCLVSLLVLTVNVRNTNQKNFASVPKQG